MSDPEIQTTDIRPDGLWRPEEWRGRYLAVRHVATPTGGHDDEENPTTIIKRELLCTSKFGAEALIFESLDTAQIHCDRLNEEAAKEAEPQDNPPSEEEEDPAQ